MKKFIEGLVFGSGFAFAFLIIAYVGFSVFVTYNHGPPSEGFEPMREESQVNYFTPSEGSARPTGDKREKVPFFDLSLEDQIKYASVIVVTEYKPGPDGKMSAIITDILKHESGATFHYAIGDEFQDSSYYPIAGRMQGDGEVIFFTGSPASERKSMPYYGDRIAALGDMPLHLFREKMP